MPLWLVRVTWVEDETEATERWEVNAATAHDAVRDVTAHIRFLPRHVEATMRAAEDASDLRPGQTRRIPPDMR